MWINDKREEILSLWETYVRPLGPKPHRQFFKATEQVQNEFARRFVWPQLRCNAGDDFDEATYLCLSDRKDLPGRNHRTASDIARTLSFLEFENRQEDLRLFTNP